MKGDATYAMSLPELSVPSSVSELRLLQALRLLTSLRPDLKGRREKSEIVSSYMEMIEFGNLWDILCESLDFVRDLEGIIDVETLDGDMDMDTSGDISLNRSTGSANDLSFSMNSGANKSSMGEVLNTPTTSLSSLTI